MLSSNKVMAHIISIIIPVYFFRISTHCTKEQIYLRIKEETEDGKFFPSWDYSKKTFEGRINRNKFKIRRIVSYTFNYEPFICGKIKNNLVFGYVTFSVILSLILILGVILFLTKQSPYLYDISIYKKILIIIIGYIGNNLLFFKLLQIKTLTKLEELLD